MTRWPNGAQWPFVGTVVLVTVLQLAAFVKMWRARRGARWKSPLLVSA
jgi:hypothetical protein